MANYPTSASTDANLYVQVNNKSTTLSDNPLTSGATTVNVASTTGFPTAGYITIDAEAISYTGVTSTSFTTCTRGADGTTATSHATGVQVFHNVVAQHHNGLKDEVKAIETDLVASYTGGSTSIATTFAKYLKLIGGTLSGALAMGSNKITGLAAPTVANDALSQNNLVPAADGAVGGPGLTFSTDLTSGLYKISAGDIGIATSGVQVAEIKTTGTTNAVTYTPVSIFGGPSNKATGFDRQVTTGVTTSAVTIYTLTRDGALVLIYGKGTAGTTAEFFDVVAFAGGGVSVIASTSGTGSPDARTYSRTGITLQLAMAAHTYTVSCATVTMQG